MEMQRKMIKHRRKIKTMVVLGHNIVSCSLDFIHEDLKLTEEEGQERSKKI